MNEKISHKEQTELWKKSILCIQYAKWVGIIFCFRKINFWVLYVTCQQSIRYLVCERLTNFPNIWTPQTLNDKICVDYNNLFTHLCTFALINILQFKKRLQFWHTMKLQIHKYWPYNWEILLNLSWCEAPVIQ